MDVVHSSTQLTILSCVGVWLSTGFGLMNTFIDHLQVVTTKNYNTIAISTLYILHITIRQPVGLLGRGISLTQSRYLHTGQQKHRIYAGIHALTGIRTHDPSVPAGEDISCLRPRGHCHRRIIIHSLWKMSCLSWCETLDLPTFTGWIPRNACYRNHSKQIPSFHEIH
jgi:hypothetical protein